MESMEEAGAQPGPMHPTRDPSDARKIRILSASLIVVLALVIAYAIVSSGVFEPPYPSEDTFLAIQPWGVTWDEDGIEGLIGICALHSPEYSNLTIAFTEYTEGSTQKSSGPFITGEFIDIEDFVAPASVEEAEELTQLMHIMYLEDEKEIDMFTGYFVSDHTDSQEFNLGDVIAIVNLVFEDGTLASIGFDEGTTYEVELYYEFEYGSAYSGFGFAVDGGELYSWLDRGEEDDPLS